MKSKKIIVSSIVVGLIIVGAIVFKLASNNSSTSKSEISEATTDASINSEGNDAPEESNDNASSNNEKTNDLDNNSNNQGTTTSNKLSGKDAVTNILKHFFSEDETKSQHITPVILNGQVAKAADNDNTFFCDSKELTDSTKTGLIIILDSYDESSNSYKYTLKDYYAIVNGKNDSMGSGTVSNDGTVTED